MATTAQTPKGRSFSSSLGYFHSFNDYFNEQRKSDMKTRQSVRQLHSKQGTQADSSDRLMS